MSYGPSRTSTVSYPIVRNMRFNLVRLAGLSGPFFVMASAVFAQTAIHAASPLKASEEPSLQRRTALPPKLGHGPLISGTVQPAPPPAIELTLSPGTPIRAILRKSLPVKKIGEPVQAYITDPVYAFDRVVIPKGSELDGHIAQLAHRSIFKKVASYLNADFSLHRAVYVDFDTLILADGARLPVNTETLPDIGPVLKLESNPPRDTLTRRAQGMVRSRWHSAISQIKPAALWTRAKSVARSYWPYHKQKIAAGSVFVVELTQSVDFGLKTIPAPEMGCMGQVPPENTEAFARLVTPLSSATDRGGAPVEAVLTRPIFSPDKKLLFPVNTALKGTVVRAEPARRLHRNGKLHFKLSRIQLPSSGSQQVEMALEGMEVPKSSNVQLDSEGATHVASNQKSRLLSTALSVGIASLSMQEDRDHGVVDPGGHNGNRALAGGSGYKLIGLALTLGIKSQPLSRWMGFWGAGESVYLHFITRGQNLVLPKDTPMEISFGQPRLHSLAGRAPVSSTASTAVPAGRE